MANNYYRAMMIKKNNEKRWLKVNPSLNHNSGIYILVRTDENGFKYAYIGQSTDILGRLAQHLAGYQHIDLSLKKHKLYDKEKNPYGWYVIYHLVAKDKLDECERSAIKTYAEAGYQLRNKTLGGQNTGKAGIDDNKASKGYRDGLAQGKKNAVREVKEYFDKYLQYLPKNDPECFKKDGTLKDIYTKKTLLKKWDFQHTF